MSDDYQPIACGAYDEIELMAMHRSEVELVFHAPGTPRRRLRGRVVDTAIHGGAEYLVLEHAGSRETLRLDRILEIEETATGKRWRQ
jgi:transcriptional antiterminator Rof (Rho-off)